jgi:hypothetical protein
MFICMCACDGELHLSIREREWGRKGGGRREEVQSK